MAPPAGKRVKGVQIYRPFVYGTTARPFDEKTNPKPPGIPDDHTHSWTVFVKGIDDVDITYWLRRVQFKLHESIPNHVRMVDGEKGKPFMIHETGWGEFEITMKLYYVPESNEKPQTLYHHLRLHPYGRNEEEKEAMKKSPEVKSWVYEEQIFNEPYDAFYDILTSGATAPSLKSSGGQKTGGKSKESGQPQRSEGGVLERSAMIPLHNRPGHPFSRDTEEVEMKKLKEAMVKVEEMKKKMLADIKAKEKRLMDLKADSAKAGS
ncbi:YEATS family domain containing protein [Rhypophila decipiens]